MFTNMMENKQQMIHIIAEIVLMIAIVFYFNQKHKKVLSLVEDLAQRVEEQEDLLQKHEEVIKKLVEGFNVLQTEQYKTHPPQAMPQQTMPKKPLK
jgi:endonuclease III